jgi:hypothetical protein
MSWKLAFNNGGEMTTIEVTDEDAELFLKFRKYQGIFERMVEYGIFDRDIIQATLYFNKFGELRTIDKTIRHSYAQLDK